MWPRASPSSSTGHSPPELGDPPSSRFQVCNAMKTHVLLGCPIGHPSPLAFPRCARFKGTVTDDVSADVVPPPAGPAPNSGSIPSPIPAGKSCSWSRAGGNWVCLKQGGMPCTPGRSTGTQSPSEGGRKLPGSPLPHLSCQKWSAPQLGPSQGCWEKRHHLLCSFTSFSLSLSAAERNSLVCFADGDMYSPNTYCLCLCGCLLCSKNKQRKIINPGAPVPSQKFNKEFSLLYFQVREDNLHYNWQSPGAESFSFTSSRENTVFCTCSMLLLWQLNFTLISETAQPWE